MSLNFDFRDVADKDRVTTHPNDLGKDPDTERVRYHPLFDAMVWTMMIIGVSKIDEKTLPTVQKRVGQYQKACGPLIAYEGGLDVYMTDADVARLVGLRTNVSNMTDAQWANHLMDILDREAHHIRKPTQTPDGFDLTDYILLQREDGTHYVK